MILENSPEPLDKDGIFVYNYCICKCCDGIIRMVRTTERGRPVKALVRAAVADLSLHCENSDVCLR